jgi:molybdopterin-containing oxidoreductase family membrane subunit
MTSIIYGLIVGGKPPISNLPYIIPTYEGTILFGAIGAFVAGLIYASLKLRRFPADYDTRFSGDSFGIDIDCRPEERDQLANLLKNAGAVEVYEP